MLHSWKHSRSDWSSSAHSRSDCSEQFILFTQPLALHPLWCFFSAHTPSRVLLTAPLYSLQISLLAFWGHLLAFWHRATCTVPRTAFPKLYLQGEDQRSFWAEALPALSSTELHTGAFGDKGLTASGKQAGTN